MLELDTALATYAEKIQPLSSETRSLSEAHGCVLASDIHAQLALPPRTQSAMDGYALRSQDLAHATTETPIELPLAFEVPAGQDGPALAPGQCARIFTGAPLPAGADSVVIQEDVIAKDGLIGFREPCPPGAHVRQQGEEVRLGQGLLSAGCQLNAEALSIAASGGHASLPCIRPVRMSIIVSGDELVAPGQVRRDAQIYESNGVFLQAFANEHGAQCIRTVHCKDDLHALSASLQEALQDSDLIVLTGGASVGDYDFSRAATQACEVQEIFWKVAQKPGKPLSFGLGPRQQAVFVLPGNPAAVHVCAHVHLRAALAALRGQTAPVSHSLSLTQATHAERSRERLLRCEVLLTGGQLQLQPLPHQASHMISNLSRTQAIARIPAGQALAAGSQVQAWLLNVTL